MAVFTSATSGLWSNPAVWVGGVKPPSAAGHSIIIAANSTGVNRLTNTAGYAIGAVNITMQAGTGTIAAGDCVQFPGDTTYYQVTTGITAAAGTITITPGLVVAIPASATLLEVRGNKVEYDEAAGEYGDDTTTGIVVNGTFYTSRSTNTSLTPVGDFKTAATTVAKIDAQPPAGVTTTFILNKSSVMTTFKWGMLIADNSNVNLVGAPRTVNTTTTVAVGVGGTTTDVTDATGWAVGDMIVFTSTDGSSNHWDNRTILTLTPTVAPAATVTFAATTYDHASGCRIGNFSSNLTIRAFDTTNNTTNKIAYFANRFTSTTNNNRRALQYISFKNIGSDNSLVNTKCFISGSNGVVISPFTVLSDCSFYNGNQLATTFKYSWISNNFVMRNLAYFGDNGMTNTMDYFASGTYAVQEDTVYYGCNTVHLQSGYSQGMQGCTFNRLYFGATPSGGGGVNIQGGAGTTFNNCNFHSSLSTAGYVSCLIADVKFNNCDFGTNQVGSPSTGYIFDFGTALKQVTKVTMTDCRYITPGTATVVRQSNTNPESYLSIVNKDNSVTAQELYLNNGSFYRDNSVLSSSTSSLRAKTDTSSAFSKTFDFLAQSGVPVTIVGHLRKNASYGASTLPTVSISGLGITPVTFTMTNSVDTWEKFTLTATQSSGAAGNLTFSFTAQSASTAGFAYLAGVPQAPFIVAARHYGYEFDESNPLRVVDSVIQQTTEATVGAYTGISIAGSTITLTSNHTIRELYDYCKWYLCQTANLSVDDFFTSTDGVNFTSSYNLTLNGGNLTGTGNLSLGSMTFSRAGSETSTVPITYNSGAAVFGNITVSGVVVGSRVRVNNDNDNIELYNSVVASGTITIPVVWTADKLLDVRVTYVSGATALKTFNVQGNLTSNMASFSISQEADTVYDTNGIDGSTVTEFTADYPNIEVDINDGDGVTSVKRLYAAFQYMTHSSQGIVYFFDGITAQDVLNYQVNTSVVDLKLDNIGSLPVVIADAYIYRDDGATIIASLSPSIQIDPKRAYGVGISGAKIFNTNNSDISIIL